MSDTKAGPRDATIDDVIEAMKQELEFERAHPEHGRHFWMNNWLFTVDLTQEVRENPNEEPGWCKTAGCIAGTAMITQARLAQWPMFEWDDEMGWLLRDELVEEATNGDTVRQILGFNIDEADAFFYPENWPRRYVNALTEEIADSTDNLVAAIRLLELKRDGRLTVAREPNVNDSGHHYEWTIDGEVYFGVHH